MLHVLLKEQGLERVCTLASRILVVDDFGPWRNWVSSKLENTEFQIVGEAEAGEEGIQKAQELEPDLVLLDIGLPDITGIEAAQRIQQLSLSCEIIFMTQAPELVQDVQGATTYPCLLKSRAATELLPAIKTALNGADISAQ